MADENIQTGEGAADQIQTGDAAGAAGQQTTGEKVDAAGQAGEPEPKTVPLASLEDERRKRQEAEQATAYYQQMLQVAQANAVQQPAQQPTNPLDEITDDDVVDGRTVKQLIQKGGQAIMQGVQQQIFAANHPDYAEIVGSVNTAGQFQPAAPLQSVLKRNPNLQLALQGNPQAYVLAYELAKAEKERLELEAKSVTNQAEAAAQQANIATTPMSPAAAGGGGALGQAARFASDPATWTDEEKTRFEQLDREVMGGRHG